MARIGGGESRFTTIAAATSAARNDFTGEWIPNPGCEGVIATFPVTAQGSTTAIPTFKVQGRVPGTTRAYDLASVTSTGVAPSGTARIQIHPAVSTAATGSSTDPLESHRAIVPLEIRVASTNASTSTVTWSAVFEFIP